MESVNVEPVIDFCQQLQNDLCDALQSIDSSVNIVTDEWTRPEGGGGISKAFSGGDVFEKGGVNFSHVFGSQLPPSATKARPNLVGGSFEAVGVSLVLHSKNPFVPTAHCNVRFFKAEKPGESPVWWFGGGFDLTPFYPFVEDCEHFHREAKKLCAPFGEDVYPKYKKWCDEYFFLKHRDEARGIGGIFFDDLNDWDFETCFQFMKAVGHGFSEAYLPIVRRRKNSSFTPEEKNFQRYRWARYVEFNLVYDRGTLFGLQSGGRTESILVSMPPEAKWGYQWAPSSNTQEALLTEKFLKPKEWI